MITDELDPLGIFTKIYINDGIILMDLYNLRKYKYFEKFINYIKEHGNVNYLNHHDQTLINYVCYNKMGILRPKYHMWPFLNEEEVTKFNRKLRIPYNESEFLEDYYNPFILHFPGHFKKQEKYKNGTFYKTYTEYSEKAKSIKNILK